MTTITLSNEQAEQLAALAMETKADLQTRKTPPGNLSIGEAYDRLRMCESIVNQVHQLAEPGELIHPSEQG